MMITSSQALSLPFESQQHWKRRAFPVNCPHPGSGQTESNPSCARTLDEPRVGTVRRADKSEPEFRYHHRHRRRRCRTIKRPFHASRHGTRTPMHSVCGMVHLLPVMMMMQRVQGAGEREQSVCHAWSRFLGARPARQRDTHTHTQAGRHTATRTPYGYDVVVAE